MYQEAVMVPTGNWAKSRLKKLSDTDKKRDNSKVLSGFGKNISNWIGRKMAYPTNVLYMATECGNKSHSATFPAALPQWFIQLFTKEGDMVLDPFMGSGTTNIVAKRMRRNSIGIEIIPKYYNIVKEELKQGQICLYESQNSVKYGQGDNQSDNAVCGEEYKQLSPKSYNKIRKFAIKNSIEKEKSLFV